MTRLPASSTSYPRRGAAFRGVGYIRPGPSGPVFAAWPRPRGKAKSAAQQQAQDDFKAACVIVKNMDPLIQAMAAEVAEGAPLLPRDLLFMTLYGRLGYLVMPDGRKVFSVAGYQDVSLLLDAIAQTKSDLMVRGDTWWQRLEVGSIGDVLTVGPTGELEWDTPTIASPLQWWQSPRPLNADVNGTAITNDAFVCMGIYASDDAELEGLNLFVQAFSGAVQIAAAIYEANPSGLTLTGGALVASGVLQNAAAGLNQLPFTAAVPLVKGTFYYLGIWNKGGSSITYMPTQETLSTRYFITSASSLPSTAPTQNLLNQQWMSQWAY